jgi:carbon storage regulator
VLVIRRRPGEAVVLSGGIEIVLLESNTHCIKLGITAPAEVTVLRKEIHLAQQANRRAAETAYDGRVLKLLSALRQPARENPSET